MRCRAPVGAEPADRVGYLLGLKVPPEVIEQGSERQIAGYRDAAVAVRQVPFRDRVPVLGALLGAALGARTWHRLNAGLRVVDLRVRAGFG